MLVVPLLGAFGLATPASAACERQLTANVVAFDQPLMYNRLGAQNVNGMMYALRRDVVDKTTGRTEAGGGVLSNGNVELRLDKRPRPLVLRMNVGDCLTVNFQNLLAAAANPFNAVQPNMQIDDQHASRTVGFHVRGMNLVDGIFDDGAYVGQNTNNMVPPGGTASYKLQATAEGGYMVYSYGAPIGGEGSGGNIASGLFGAINVEPRGAIWYRSQVAEEDMRLATVGATPQNQPIIDYGATFPAQSPWTVEGKAGDPILNMLSPANEIIYSDINAAVAGPNPDGSFAPSVYPLESQGFNNPAYPDRIQAYREFTVIFHDEVVAQQAFPAWYLDPVFKHTLHGVRDAFMINYGSGGIGTEIIANRLGVGPMHDCLSCAYEEFFLSSYSVGDPANLVDVPANVGLEFCDPALNNCAAVGPKATEILYPDDSANVHHSYQHDNVKFRNLHAGPLEHHMFHLHNHQWLSNPNDDNANYLDVQGIGPGGSYTYEITFGGTGNRNMSAGDAIFHCHFYPHFAQGMWEMWRGHDVFESGTPLAVSGGAGNFHATPFALQSGKPAAGVRALPDGEVIAGAPIPALVPLPGQALAVMPGKVEVIAQDRDGDGIPESSQARIDYTDTNAALVNHTAVLPQYAAAAVTDPNLQLNPLGLKNPGYPFWIAGIEFATGQRNTTAPLDMTPDPTNPTDGGWDGGLPRHILEGYAAGGVSTSVESRFDFSKSLDLAPAVFLPETGTEAERVAMAFHSVAVHPSSMLLQNGGVVAADYQTNGQPPVVGAPFFEPCRDDNGQRLLGGQSGYGFFDSHGGTTNGANVTIQHGADNPRVYKAADIQLDVVFNKQGDHFPQQRIISLWEDVAPTLAKTKAPEPFVIRLNTYDCADYLQTNLIPEFYELDDYQVRTPTDIIGQHIHLPKWDLVSADGSGNGWNYEDGVLAAETVRERIAAINAFNALNNPTAPQLTPLPHPFFGTGPNGAYLGARTIFQRWFVDPLHNKEGDERGLGITFTHDHFGPSTHQQVGLYATLLIEPYGSTWVHNETGAPLNTRADGGPTTWQAAILADINGDGKDDSWREFYLNGSDFQHAYKAGVFVGVNASGAIAPPSANTFRDAMNPSVKEEAPLPDIIRHLAACPGGVPRPCPEAISADEPGFFVVNYRNEPVGYRVYDPNRIGPDGKRGAQAAGLAGDLSYALQSRTDRKIAAFNTVLGNTPYPAPLTGDVKPGDPFTPMLRVLDGDIVRLRLQWGGQEETHMATVSGQKWLKEGGSYGISPNSGWKGAQGIGIAEKFSFASPVVRTLIEGGASSDYMWSGNVTQDGMWSGMWGLMRSYAQNQPNLFTLPNNNRAQPIVIGNAFQYLGICPISAPTRNYHVIATAINDVGTNPLGATIVPADPAALLKLGATPKANGGTLVYNTRDGGGVLPGPLHDPTAMTFVLAEHVQTVPRNLRDRLACALGGVLNPNCPISLKPDAPKEPLVLRSAAGECINVLLTNRLPATAYELAGYSTLPPIIQRDRNDPLGPTSFNNNLITASTHVALHPQLLEYNAEGSDGFNVGQNRVSSAAPGQTRLFRMYAGDLQLEPHTGVRNRLLGGLIGTNFNLIANPVEYGATNLNSSDPIKAPQKGLFGSMLVMPQNATWTEDPGQHAQANVSYPGGSFRSLALLMHKGMNLRYGDGAAVEPFGAVEGALAPEDAEDGGQAAMNYATEPLWYRFGFPANTPLTGPGSLNNIPNAWMAFSNDLVGGDPETPVFTATADEEVRLSLTMAGGPNRAIVFGLDGHNWQRQPYLSGAVPSQRIGNNPLAWTTPFEDMVMAEGAFNIVTTAGGVNGVTGDYLVHDDESFGLGQGLWGLLRVQAPQ